MKKIIAIILIIISMLCFYATNKVYATDSNATNNELKGEITEQKEDSQTLLERYKESYGSDAYGITAYVLHLVRIYSIPFCFLGITISGIFQYVIGIRKLDVREKGLTMMVTFVSLLVICQILPLAFTIVVKFGRG